MHMPMMIAIICHSDFKDVYFGFNGPSHWNKPTVCQSFHCFYGKLANSRRYKDDRVLWDCNQSNQSFPFYVNSCKHLTPIRVAWMKCCIWPVAFELIYKNHIFKKFQGSIARPRPWMWRVHALLHWSSDVKRTYNHIICIQYQHI